MTFQSYVLFVNGEPKRSADRAATLQDLAAEYMRPDATISIRLPTLGDSMPRFLAYSFEEKRWSET